MFSFLRSLLALSAPIEADADDQARLLRTGPNSRFAEYEYREILSESVPRLVDAIGFPVLALLCDTLETSVCSSRVQNGGPGDLSRIWRPAIAASSDDEHGPDIEQVLVSSVRDAAEQVVRGGEELDEVVALLLDRPYRIFHRVAFHLLAEFTGIPSDSRARCLTTRAYFDDVDLYREYSILVEQSFGRLSAPDQKTILGWVREGPSACRPFLLRNEAEVGTRATDARVRKTWERDQLARFGASLPPNWKRRLEALTGEIGPPKVLRLGVWLEETGPRSPLALDEMLQMPVGEVVAFLRSWQPSDPSGWNEPSSEGLGRALESAVQAKPAAYAVGATDFTGLDPAYVEALLSGLQRATTEQDVSFPGYQSLGCANGWWINREPSRGIACGTQI